MDLDNLCDGFHYEHPAYFELFSVCQFIFCLCIFASAKVVVGLAQQHKGKGAEMKASSAQERHPPAAKEGRASQLQAHTRTTAGTPPKYLVKSAEEHKSNKQEKNQKCFHFIFQGKYNGAYNVVNAQEEVFVKR